VDAHARLARHKATWRSMASPSGEPQRRVRRDTCVCGPPAAALRVRGDGGPMSGPSLSMYTLRGPNAYRDCTGREHCLWCLPICAVWAACVVRQSRLGRSSETVFPEGWLTLFARNELLERQPTATYGCALAAQLSRTHIYAWLNPTV
jgi:hypothetical protein